jgi:hypothetical protein
VFFNSASWGLIPSSSAEESAEDQEEGTDEDA